MVTYDEMVSEELSEYHNAGVVSEIDAEVIAEGLKGEGTFCDECKSKMHYEGWLNDDGSSYRALAVCDNPACRNVFEF